MNNSQYVKHISAFVTHLNSWERIWKQNMLNSRAEREVEITTRQKFMAVSKARMTIFLIYCK